MTNQAAKQAYRQATRLVFQSMSDEALRFQNSVVVGGIDREELEREISRRATEAEAAAWEFNQQETNR